MKTLEASNMFQCFICDKLLILIWKSRHIRVDEWIDDKYAENFKQLGQNRKKPRSQQPVIQLQTNKAFCLYICKSNICEQLFSSIKLLSLSFQKSISPSPSTLYMISIKSYNKQVQIASLNFSPCRHWILHRNGILRNHS
jgi:hypothetical protein